MTSRAVRVLRWCGWAIVAGFAGLLILRPETLPSREVLAGAWRWSLAPAALLALAAVALSVLLRAARWVILAAEPRAGSPLALMAGYAWCTLLLQILPYRSGDAAKVLWMKLRGGSALKATVALVAERILDLACLSIVAVAALLLDPRLWLLFAPGAPALAAAAAVAAAAVAAATLGLRYLRRSGAASAAAADAIALLRGPARFLQCAALSLGAWLALLACYAVLLQATVATPLPAALAALAGTTLATVLVLTPGSVGLFETAGVLVLALYAVGVDVALAVVVLVHAVVFGGQLLAGLAARVYLWLERPADRDKHALPSN